MKKIETFTGVKNDAYNSLEVVVNNIAQYIKDNSAYLTNGSDMGNITVNGDTGTGLGVEINATSNNLINIEIRNDNVTLNSSSCDDVEFENDYDKCTVRLKIVKNNNLFLVLTKSGDNILIGWVKDDTGLYVVTSDSFYTSSAEKYFMKSFFGDDVKIDRDGVILMVQAVFCDENHYYKSYGLKDVYYILGENNLIADTIVEIDGKEYYVLYNKALVLISEE